MSPTAEYERTASHRVRWAVVKVEEPVSDTSSRWAVRPYRRFLRANDSTFSRRSSVNV